MSVKKLSKNEQQTLVRLEISKWFDQYHDSLMQLRARAHTYQIPFEVHTFTKSQAERFAKYATATQPKPRLKCLVLLTPYHLEEIIVLIEHFHQQALDIIERFELKKHPKLLEKPLIIEDVIAVNFTKNPAISILKIEPDDAIEWFDHQLEMIYENIPQPIENPSSLQEIHLLSDSIEQINIFKLQSDATQVLKRFYQSGFSYRATLRFANHTQQVLSLNEFLFIVGHNEQLPHYGDSTQLPYPRKKRADTILKSDRNVVAETGNELHYYFWEHIKEKPTKENSITT